jgi:hypothetical protein
MSLPIRGTHPVSRGIARIKRRVAVPARKRRRMPCADAVLVLHDRLPTRLVYLIGQTRRNFGSIDS